MSKAVIEERVQFLSIEVQKSAAQHNALVGRLEEAKELLATVVLNEAVATPEAAVVDAESA